MNGQQDETPARKRFPAFWGDIPLREMAIRNHRQMTLHAAISLMHSQLGRAPSKSALARFWKTLDARQPIAKPSPVERDNAAMVLEYRARLKAAADTDQGRVAVYAGKINSAGVITMPGRRYWSDDLCSRIGMEVEVHLDLDGPYASVWSKGRMHRLCTAALLDDGPYADATSIDAMRETAQKLKAERASVVRGQIAELLDILDQRVERSIERALTRNRGARHHGLRNGLDLLQRAWALLLGNRGLRHDERPQGVDLDLEKIEAVLNRGAFGHRAAPSADDTAEPATQPASPHRLSETPE